MDQVKLLGDTLSLSIVVATLVSWLPPIASLLSIIWLTIQIYEWNKHRKDK